jgi:hypothetical protein
MGVFREISILSDSTQVREERRPIIIKGIRRDLNYSEIAAQARVNRWVIMSDLRYMKHNRDPELKQAQMIRDKIRAEKRSYIAREKIHVKQNERFQRMMGMTIQEKTFRNMIDFYKPELLKILRSSDQNAAIMKLSRSVRKTLILNGVITYGRNHREIASDALEYLAIT